MEHFLDDRFGGAAFLKDSHGFLLNPKAYLKAKLKKSKSHGVISNPKGLTSFGEQFVRKMMQQKVWIDLAHSSDETQKSLISLHEDKDLPLLYTHTVLRKHYSAERALNSDQLRAVKTSKGIIGLMPCDEMLVGTATSSDSDHSLGRFSVHYDEVATQIGQNSTVIGSDFNGGIGQIGGCCSQTASQEFQKKGLAHIGMLPEFWKALREHSKMVPQELAVTVENFIQTWQNYESRC